MGESAMKKPEVTISSQQFKAAMRCLAATPSIITANDGACRFGMTATAVNAVSADPPSVLVCINRNASIFQPVSATQWFCVNVLESDHQDLCRVFSGGESGERRFEHGDWAAGMEGLPYLKDAQASLFCRVEQQAQFTTHQIFIGRIVGLMVGVDVSPLIYLDGEFLHKARSKSTLHFDT
jgi:flavin reductase (DIM6/NTAB) family NADH-FMN oxidoreductase RutF